MNPLLTGTEFCYFKSTLSSAEQKAFDTMKTGFLAHQSRIPVHGITPEQVGTVFEKLKRDIPMLYYVEKISYQYNMLFRNDVTIIPVYRFHQGQIEATNEAIYNRIKPIIAKAKKQPTQWMQEKTIHDYLCNNVRYDKEFKDSSYEFVGPLLYGRGVCEGISRATKLMFDMIGIKSLVVHGSSKNSLDNMHDNSHAWNIVFIDEIPYHLDVTFDLTIKTDCIRYDYFNLSDTYIRYDHDCSDTKIPVCRYNNDYYSSIGVFMKTPDDFRIYLEKCIKNGQYDIIVRIPYTSNSKKAENELMNIAKKVMSKHSWRLKQFQMSQNPGQCVFYIKMMKR